MSGFFFFSSRRRHTRYWRDWSSDVCSSDLPNDHVNMGQSSNDVFPSAVHLAALAEATDRLVPPLERLHPSLAAKANEVADVVKAGRTHPMDAVPATPGQEFQIGRAPCRGRE